MKRVLLGAASTFFLVVASVQAAPVCDRAIPVHGRCEIALSELHPTQSAVGMMQVEERATRLHGEHNFARFTSSHAVPVVQAPDGRFYLTDSHHLVSMLHRLGATTVTAEVIGRLTDPTTFWTDMQVRHWVYLYDTKGNPIAPSALPQRIDDLTDDPYRALASYAENAGYFHKTDAYFMEFEWARYLGTRMGWRPVNRLNLLGALQEAERLACQPEAQALPGYAGPCKGDQ